MDLFLKPKGRNYFIEHHEYYHNEDRIEENTFDSIPQPILFNNNPDKVCFQILDKECFQTSYFVGVDWILENQKAVYIQPKLNKDSLEQTDYLRMLFDALKHPEVSNYVDELFEIKWDSKPIEIEQEQDLLTPLLVVHFLRLVKRIVQKGLKKSYYKVEQNLHAKVKGKIMVSKTIKHNILKNKNLHTFCSFDEFGINGLENRLLKKALTFIQRYILSPQLVHAKDFIEQSYNYINPAFEFVSCDVNINEIKHAKTNSFYKEYGEAIKLAKIILKRFGYNITNVKPNNKISTPPFWIDMSKLFELYVLGKLIDKFPSHGEVIYNKHYNFLIPDYLIKSKDGKCKMVVDAKYKPRYDIKEIEKEDLRQVAGYARLLKVYEELGITDLKESIECLIIFSNQNSQNENFDKCTFRDREVDEYTLFFKEDIKLPIIKSSLK
jgi:5-methylcytosine-specific restriction enzyme subunit McrC